MSCARVEDVASDLVPSLSEQLKEVVAFSLLPCVPPCTEYTEITQLFTETVQEVLFLVSLQFMFCCTDLTYIRLFTSLTA